MGDEGRKSGKDLKKRGNEKKKVHKCQVMRRWGLEAGTYK